ncbi:peptide-methionine (S)-S-oxide reductase MsrA [Mariniflexile sp. AS56]|uniref:peptide-methionine (S)-S-oxide reductase MsrA n=1 Tax=Mariniflexile sp. AS56 TaxID=3063957 RepID=UPI0026F18295|nr:peptide-methionine (S)-S-oxide reductase MsrA [Mariniflexile sp. AS56]MDO7170865.1 peptide-methionine (S)-S-oxide reductase MsrA [Mariniflexile sp. AS56]
MSLENRQVATFGGGCFWCAEAVFRALKGVETVESGYSGGNVPGHPTYREIRSGLTGHAEVVQVVFNSACISYKDLLVVFMTTHNPTTLNKQGGDVGTQYRSVIFYQDETEKKIAETVIEEMGGYFNDSIVTVISPFKKFFKAEDYHQDYYKNNKAEAYCHVVIMPKLAKLRELHANKLK